MNRNEQKNISDEQLCAYIDDELDFEERSRIVEQLEQDDQLTHEAQELRQLQALMRHAYRMPPTPPDKNKAGKGSRGSLNALAAGLFLAFGVVAGWYGNEQFVANTQTAQLIPTHAVQLHTAASTQDNLLLHISSNDPAKMDAALSYAEQTLANAQRHNDKNFRLEVVANNGGIEMLRRDTSPYSQRIEKLLSKYHNVSFLACANALQKLRDQGVKVELLPGTRSDHSAVDEIVDRLEGGWRYLKV